MKRTCRSCGAPWPSLRAPWFGLEQSGTRWRSRCCTHLDQNLPVLTGLNMNRAMCVWQRSKEVGQTQHRLSTANIGNTWDTEKSKQTTIKRRTVLSTNTNTVENIWKKEATDHGTLYLNKQYHSKCSRWINAIDLKYNDTVRELTVLRVILLVSQSCFVFLFMTVMQWIALTLWCPQRAELGLEDKTSHWKKNSRQLLNKKKQTKKTSPWAIWRAKAVLMTPLKNHHKSFNLLGLR